MLAAAFGAGGNTNPIFNLDTYYAAFRIPDLIFNLLSYGMLSAAFVPLFVGIMKKNGKQEAFKFTNDVLHFIALAVMVISLVLFAFAPYILKAIVPGFAPADFGVTVRLTRLMLITPLFFTISSVAGGVANSLHKFAGLSLAPVFYNLSIIVGILLFAKTHGVYGAAIGVSAGAALHAAIQLPSIIRAGYRYAQPTAFWNAGIKEMILLSLPRILGMSAAQLALVVNTIIASTLAAGSITVINFATNLQSLPVGLIGISVAVVSFGVLSSHAAEGKTAEFINELKTNIRRILMLLVPSAFGMAMLRNEVVQLLLARGKFDLNDSILTANTLGILLAGLVFGGLLFLLARAFYAMKDTKTPVVISIIAVILNTFLSLLLTKYIKLNTYGLAFANAAADILNAALLVYFLNKKLGRSIIDWIEISKYIAAAVIMSAAVYLIKNNLWQFFENLNFYPKLVLEIASAAIVGAAVYYAVCRFLGAKEIKNLYNKTVL